MNLLAMDTSGPSLSVAVLKDGVLCCENTLHNGLTHSQTLMMMVEQVLTSLNMTPQDVSMIAVVDGPGSFTGVRIGVAAAKGLARAVGAPVIGVNALEALACGVGDRCAVACPIRDARAGQVYGAAFRAGERLMADAVVPLPQFLEHAAALGDELLFVGDGVPPHRQAIADILGAKAHFAPPHLMHLKAGAVGALAYLRQDQAIPGADLVPRYLRAPQAERERLAKEGRNV